METKSLVDLFDLYDLSYDRVCDDLGISIRPAWQHRWFYRFYQVSLSPQYVAMCENLVAANKKFPNDELENFYKYGYIYGPYRDAYYKFYSTFTDSFPIWWYNRARQHFSMGKEDVYELMLFKREIEFTKQGRYLMAGEFCYQLRKFSEIDARPDYKVIFMPMLRTKDETLKLFEKYIDETEYFSPGFHNQSSSFYVPRVKVSEKSVKDCYRYLEYRAFNPKDDLVTVALNSGIKKGAASALDKNNPKDAGNPSLNSLKVGMTTLNKQALNLLCGASKGIFPTSFDWLEDSWGRKNVSNFSFIRYFDSNPSWLFRLVKKKIPHPDQMYDSIKSDLLSLGDSVFK